MSDQSKSIHPDDLPDSAVFRETFLAHFDPEEAAALRRAGEVLFDRVLEGEPYDSGELGFSQELRAAGLELSHLVESFREIGQCRHHGATDDLAHAHCRQADVWAEEVLRVMGDVLATVGPVPASRGEELS